MVRIGDGDLYDPERDGFRLRVIMDTLLVLGFLIGLWLLLQLVILPRLGFDT